MCYVCSLCSKVAPHGQPKLVHQVIRHRREKVVIGGRLNEQVRTEIAQELPVCADCHFQLTVVGLSLEEIRRKQFRLSLPAAPTIKPAPLSPVKQGPTASNADGWKTKTIR